MSTAALAPHDAARLAYARAAYLRAYRWRLEQDVVAGHITPWNAEKNLSDMIAGWSTPDIVTWAKWFGLEPIWEELPPKHGPGYPVVHPRLRHWRTSRYARPNSEWRTYIGEPCEHRWIVFQQSGFDCNDCFQHFGMWD